MKKNALFTVFLAIALNSVCCFAAFEYSGTFSANRNPNEVQSYYILLNENSNVTFSLKSNGKDCKEVFVNSIKLSSDESVFCNSETGITNYKITTTGIYEVSVTSPVSTDKTIDYILTVSDSADNLEKKDTTETTNINTPEISENSKTENTQSAQNTVTEAVTTSISKEIKDTDNKDSSVKSNETLINPTKTQTVTTDSQTVYADDEELNPDTPAVEDDSSNTLSESSIEPDKKLSYNGKLTLAASFDAFKFLSDKNKSWPKAICFENNNLWVLDGQLCRITCYNTRGTEINSFGSKGQAINQLGIPVSMALFKDFVLIGDRQKNCIHIYSKKGDWLNAIQNDPNVGLKISNPVSISIKGEEIWVGDGSTNRILCFDKNFSFLGSFGSTRDSKIESITSISTDNEYIYILEEEGILKKFGSMGNFLAAVPTDSKYAVSLLVDSNKNFWITDLEKGAVYCISDEGKTLFSIDRKKLSGLFSDSNKFAPSSIAISNSAKIAVADTYSKQIKIFEIK